MVLESRRLHGAERFVERVAGHGGGKRHGRPAGGQRASGILGGDLGRPCLGHAPLATGSRAFGWSCGGHLRYRSHPEAVFGGRRMNDPLAMRLRRTLRITIWASVGMVLAWALTPAKPFFAGLLLGTTVSMYNAYHAARRVRGIVEGLAQPTGRARGIGTMARLAMAAAAGLLVARFPHVFSVVGVVVGLPVAPLVAACTLLADALRNRM